MKANGEAGGATCLSRDHYQQANGYSNDYWSWGTGSYLTYLLGGWMSGGTDEEQRTMIFGKGCILQAWACRDQSKRIIGR